MNKENIVLASEIVEISESNTYLELTSRICYYDDTNANGVLLPSEGAKEKADTLVNMPVQAHYRTSPTGQPTFGGHQMTEDANGDITFGTESIGTHTEVYIENADVNVHGAIKNLPCLYAKYRIWKRYENCVAAVRRLFSLGKLYGSWEILISSYEFKDGIKYVNDYEFLANTLLGYEFATPSYGVDAKAISLSNKNNECLLVAEALSQDIISRGLDIENEAKEEKFLDKKKKTTVAEEVVEETVEDTPVADTTVADTTSEGTKEVSQLTEWDLRDKIKEACHVKLDKWCWVAWHFPVEKEVWVEVEDRETELDFVRMTYTVENDVVTVSEPEPVKLTVNIAEVNSTIESLNTDIATKDEAIIKSGEEITELKSQIAELIPFKEQFEKAEQERIEAEIAEKKENLISSITKSGLITRDEIESSEELKGFVDSLDDKSLKAVLAERYMASFNAEKAEVAETVAKTEVASTNLDGLEDEAVNVKNIMKNYFGK